LHFSKTRYYAGKNNEAIQIFEWALSIYPGNLNLYDSMGEMQENTGSKNLALGYYIKGIIIGGDKVMVLSLLKMTLY